LHADVSSIDNFHCMLFLSAATHSLITELVSNVGLSGQLSDMHLNKAH